MEVEVKMLQNDKDKMKCESCNKLISKDDYTGPCQICFKGTCINCRKICNRCLETFCTKHSTKKVVWRSGIKEEIVLCDMCKEIVKL